LILTKLHWHQCTLSSQAFSLFTSSFSVVNSHMSLQHITRKSKHHLLSMKSSIVVDLRVCVSGLPRSALRSSEMLIYRKSADRTTEVPKCQFRHFGSAKCRYSAFRASDLGNKGMSLSCVYIKASEFQYRFSLLLELAGYRPLISFDYNKATLFYTSFLALFFATSMYGTSCIHNPQNYHSITINKNTYRNTFSSNLLLTHVIVIPAQRSSSLSKSSLFITGCPSAVLQSFTLHLLIHCVIPLCNTIEIVEFTNSWSG